MKKSVWILSLFAVCMFSAAGASFAQLHNRPASPAILCGRTCQQDGDCGGVCPACVIMYGQGYGKCASIK